MRNARRVFALLLALLMVFALCACGQKAPAEEGGEADGGDAAPVYTSLRVGLECAYAPNNWMESEATDSNLPIDNQEGGYAEGYDIQIAKLIGEELGVEIVPVMLSWDGLIEALNQGQIDAIIAGMLPTAERKEAINFTDPYHTTEYGVMVKAGSAYENATTINDFVGATVLGQKDTYLDTVIDQMEGVEHLTPVSSVPNMISRLQEDTCDALVVNVENSDSYLAANPDFVLIRFAEGNGFEMGENIGACVGLRYSDTALLEQINAALATIDIETRDALWADAVANQPK